MSLEIWVVYAFAALALSVTPGPNGLLCLNHAVRFGFRRTVFTALGSIVGMTILIGASMAGLGALMLTSEMLFSVVKWIGAAYLIALGLRMWFAPAATVTVREATGLDVISRRRAGFQGAMVALSNPKALLFFATFLPQFMQPGVSLWLQFAIFAGTFAAIEFAYELMLAGAGRQVAGWIARHGRVFNRVTGGAFMGVGGTILFSER
ncbi:LysE family translocator [Fodinicurvata sp. EGI_FJ10296]|uniref:LysE family translocator n=1 Tax=Fodinicurvata sp. EGI_FJ10296 TaxID=3231908 RepID=UPI00345243D1